MRVFDTNLTDVYDKVGLSRFVQWLWQEVTKCVMGCTILVTINAIIIIITINHQFTVFSYNFKYLHTKSSKSPNNTTMESFECSKMCKSYNSLKIRWDFLTIQNYHFPYQHLNYLFPFSTNKY